MSDAGRARLLSGLAHGGLIAAALWGAHIFTDDPSEIPTSDVTIVEDGGMADGASSSELPASPGSQPDTAPDLTTPETASIPPQPPAPETVASSQRPDVAIRTSTAPTDAMRPRARPAPAERPEPAADPVVAPAAEPETAPLHEPETTVPVETAADTGGPVPALTPLEARGLVIALGRYMTQGSELDPAIRLVVRVQFTQDGRVVGEPELVERTGGMPAAQSALFAFARRAILRAANDGVFQRLPAARFASWERLDFVVTPRAFGAGV